MTDNPTSPTQSYAPGWYPDTNSPGNERYFDGTQWTDQVRPAVPASSEVTTVEPPAKKKGLRWWAWVLIGLGALLLLIIIIGSLNRPADVDDPDPVGQSQVDEEEPAEEEPVVEEEEEPAEPEAGTLENPFPKGYELEIYQGSPDNTLATMTVAIKEANANASIAQANQFNEPAQPGYHYVAVDYTITGASKDEPASASVLLWDWTLSTDDGTQIGESNTTVVLPDGWNQVYDLNDLYEGQTGTATVIYQVPDDYKGTLFATAYGQYVTL